jgi:hypothetical protein
MAGRPAAGPSSGILGGLIAFVVIALISLVMLVFLWTKQEDLKLAAQRANEEARRVMSSGERTGAFRGWFDAATGSKSVAKLMHQEMSTMAKTLSGEETVAPGYAAQQVAQLEQLTDRITAEALVSDATKIADQPLVQAMGELYDQFSDLHEQYTLAKENESELMQERDQLVSSKEELQKEFGSTVAALQQKVDAFESEWGAYRDEKQNVIDDTMDANTERAEEAESAAQRLRDEIATLRGELGKKQAKNEELQDKIRDFQIVPQPRMAARQADGEVILANPGEESVFINLGRNDHLTLGLIFAVYPVDTGIPSSGLAKAQIEVASIGDQVSECQIKWVDPMQPIIEGDMIANPVYDRSRRLKFVVIGNYDLDYDGYDDPNGAGVVESVIADMRGVIDEQLSARTDFVIVGARPLVRHLPNDASDEDRAIHQDMRSVAQQYDAQIEEAKSLSIPMLTQETFLNFLGRKRKAAVDVALRE